MDALFEQLRVPHRMQPGLRRLPDDASHLTPLQRGGALYADKQRVLAAGQSRHAWPGFDPAPAMEAIAEQAEKEWAEGTFDVDSPLELAFEEDFAVLDGASGTVPWLCVCVPSHWAPEDKLGHSLAALHGPVADNAQLVAASQPLVQLATGGGHWERFVWTLSPSARYDQHPRRHARAPWLPAPGAADADALAAACHLRAERQTFFPVGRGTAQAIFTIRVVLQPLARAVQAPGRARRLHDALASMSDAVLHYKGLAGVRAPLLQWLDRQAA